MDGNSDWSFLPPDLIEEIIRKFITLADYVRFRAVCPNWRALTPKFPIHLPCQLPWLMLPQSDPADDCRAFFCPFSNELYFLNLPEASDFSRRRCGSSHGWLTIIGESSSVFLINPLTRAKIDLPLPTKFIDVTSLGFLNVDDEYDSQPLVKDVVDAFIWKVVFSGSPSSESDFVVFAICDLGDLVYWKSGQSSWNWIGSYFCTDVTYFNGLFYALHNYGDILVFDVSGVSPEVEFINTHKISTSPGRIPIPIPTPRLMKSADCQYIVNAIDELLLVAGYIHVLEIGYRTYEFRVFRLDSEMKLERLMSLGEKMLFLGENSSMALLASDFPGCKGNKIYFTDVFLGRECIGENGRYDMGIFDLEDGSFEPFPCYPQTVQYPLLWPPPIWVTPNPC